MTAQSVLKCPFVKVVSMALIAIVLVTMIPVQAYAGKPQPSVSAMPGISPELAGMLPTIGPDGQPDGMLINPQALEPDPVRQPRALNQSLTVARAQSVQTAADALASTLVLTLTITNNMPPTEVPTLPDGATITDTIEATANFTYADDPNTIRDVLLTTRLTSNATLVAASFAPDQQGTQYAWSLDAIPPLSSRTVALTLTTTADGASFVPLDEGARAYGTLRGRMVEHQAPVATLAPDRFSQWLVRTPDADTQDEYMLEQLASLGSDPQTLFAYVRSLMGYEVYHGSLRGTRGTLWSEAGNSTDQASLLVAMLRASGIPARYRHGTLTTERAQELILAMFPPVSGVIGHIPPETPVSDPANDPVLLAETQDHWWVEAYIDGAWTDLDPSFALAQVGDTFATPVDDATDRIAELPAAIRHQVTVRLKVEHYSQLAVIRGSLPVSYPLEHTFNTVDLVGTPVTLAHLVNRQGGSGLVFATLTTDYLPYLIVGEDVIEGENYQDVASSFLGPLGSRITTGAWLEFAVRDGRGTVEAYERELVDRVGFEMRQGGGSVDVALDAESAPLFDTFDVYTTWFWASSISHQTADKRVSNIFGELSTYASESDRLEELAQQSHLSITEQIEYNRIQARLQRHIINLNAGLGLALGASMDDGIQQLSTGFFVRAYSDTPRIVLVSSHNQETTTELTIDLRNTLLRTVAYPRQTEAATYSFHVARGLLESSLEGGMLSAATNQQALTTARVFNQAKTQGIPFLWLEQDNLDDLQALDLSSEAEARITRAVQNNVVVILPERPVIIDEKSAIGWFEIDGETGETIGVMENGQHVALISLTQILKNVSIPVIAMITFLQGFATYSLLFLGEWWSRDFDKALLEDAFNSADDTAEDIDDAQEYICKYALKPARVKNAGKCDQYEEGASLMRKYLERRLGSDPPLSVGYVSYPQTQLQRTVVALQSITSATLPAAPIAATLTAPNSSISGSPGAASLYAPALGGMGVGGDGTAVGTANFAPDVDTSLTDARLLVGPATGSVQLGDTTLQAPNGLAIAGYDGPLTVSENNVATDSVTLESTGNVDLFTLDLSADSSTTDPNTAISFDTEITANFNDTYTITVEAPAGWNVALSEDGQVTATPPRGTAPGDYSLLVSAQSRIYPDLVVSAVHVVTTTAFEGVAATITPDTLITVPWGDPAGSTFDSTNDGRIQLPDAAYTVDITNTSTTAHTFAVRVNDLPNGWTIFAGEIGTTATTLTLPAGEATQVGLYISPTLELLPPAGTRYPFAVDVTATDDSGLSASATDVFEVPGIAYAHLSATPAQVYSTPGAATTFDVILHNVGNTSGTFPLLVEPPTTTWTLANLNAPVTLSQNEWLTQSLTLQTPDGALGERYVIDAATRSGAYTQTAAVAVQLVAAEAVCAYQTAQAVDGPIGETLAAALRELGAQLDQFSGNLDDPSRRAQVVTALRAVAGQLVFQRGLADLRTRTLNVANRLETAALADLPTDLEALCTTMDDLGARWQVVTQHGVAARFAPGAVAALPGDNVPTALRLTNQGTEPTAYRVSLTAPIAGLPAPQTITLQPGEVRDLAVPLTPTDLGFFSLAAAVEAVDAAGDPLGVTADATAGINVVDAFVRVLNVAPTPPFVETGVSSTTITAQVANVANVPRTAIAHTAVISPDGHTVFSDTTTLGIRLGDPYTSTLTTVDTSGFASGTYTVRVELRDEAGDLIPDGRGTGYLVAGQGLLASHAVTPTLVAPGDVRVTTAITTQLLDTYDFNSDCVSLYQSVVYTDFSDLSAFTLSSEAAARNSQPVISGNQVVLRLTDTSSSFQSASAFLTQPVCVLRDDVNASFSTLFQFQMTEPRGIGDEDGAGADGIAFVIARPGSIGQAGGGIGYEGIIPSLIVEFDSYRNSVDPNGNHVGINLDGNRTSRVTQFITPPFNDGDIWYAWVDYMASSNLLEVRLATEPVRPPEPTITDTVDIVSLLAQSLASFGFTSATGAGIEIHDIRSWSFNAGPLAAVLPISLSHTLPPNGVEPIDTTYSAPPDTPAPLLSWSYIGSASELTRTTSFAATLPAMRPGEVRQVSDGTEIVYTIGSGSNRLTLPPLFVAAAHIIAVEPLTRTTAAGSTAAYTVELFNPGTTADTYQLATAGLPTGWATLPATVTVPAGARRTVPLTINPPLDARQTDYTFSVIATTSTGGTDQAQATLTVGPPQVQVTLEPGLIEAGYGAVVSYTLRITNLTRPGDLYNPDDPTARYTLSLSGLGSNPHTLPASISVPGLSTASIVFTVTAEDAAGFYPFQVTVSSTQAQPPIQVSAPAALVVVGGPAVAASLAPTPATTGQGTPARLTLSVTNTGTLSDTYDLSVQTPAGWSAELLANNDPHTSLTLAPFVFNVATLDMLVTPPTGTSAGTYPITVTATSRRDPATTAIATGQIVVTGQGVAVAITPARTTLQPDEDATWEVTITNTGTQADTFDLVTGGVIATNARLSSAAVTLEPGAATTVQYTGGPFPFALPGSLPFAITAQSQTEPAVAGTDTATVAFTGQRAAVVQLSPTSQTLTDTGTVSYLAVISNTGNLDTNFALQAEADTSDAVLTLEIDEVYIPAHMAAAVLLDVAATPALQTGAYSLTLEATASGGLRASDAATLDVRMPAVPMTATLQFAQNSLVVPETIGTAALTVTLSRALDEPVSVDYTTIPGTAAPIDDYEPVSGTLTFAAQQTNQIITIPIVADLQREQAETFTVVLENQIGVTLQEPMTATVTIVDDRRFVFLPIVAKE